MAEIRTFETGAKRDQDLSKLDYEAFLCPRVVHAYATYMNFNRICSDGSRREGDNWQKGIPIHVYTKSLWRHVWDIWAHNRGINIGEPIVWALCAVMFNAMGILHELLKKNPEMVELALLEMTARREKAENARRLQRPSASFMAPPIETRFNPSVPKTVQESEWGVEPSPSNRDR